MEKFTLVRQEGGSRVIAVTSFVPKEWKAVDLSTVKEDKEIVILKIKKVK